MNILFIIKIVFEVLNIFVFYIEIIYKKIYKNLWFYFKFFIMLVFGVIFIKVD